MYTHIYFVYFVLIYVLFVCTMLFCYLFVDGEICVEKVSCEEQKKLFFFFIFMNGHVKIAVGG